MEICSSITTPLCLGTHYATAIALALAPLSGRRGVGGICLPPAAEFYSLPSEPELQTHKRAVGVAFFPSTTSFSTLASWGGSPQSRFSSSVATHSYFLKGT